jgi:2-hydroxyacyl-CoA lyase 1
LATIDGATLIARCLKQHGVDYCFGIVGVPVFGVATAMQKEGIYFVGVRHEQTAAYAAGAIGYLTGRPGVALTVSGPGMTNAISGLGNAQVNCWPMILLGGANRIGEMQMGAFQEAPQVEAARLFSKYAARPESTARLPYFIEQAVRIAMYGRPGPTYLDLTADVIDSKVEEEDVILPPRVADPPRSQADPEAVAQAMALLRNAESPLVIVGKGAAYARAEDEVTKFVESTQLPFLATPMGKGVLPDDHPLSVAAARTQALQNADVVLLAGARLNWMLHFGLPPRFREEVKIIQMDIVPEEMSHNVATAVPLLGDIRAITRQLNAALESDPWQYPAETTWRTSLQRKIEENTASNEEFMNDDSVPMGYYRVLREIRDMLPRDAIICNEGAGTLDLGRQVLNNYLPRHRLDAGTWGTMGVGLAFALAAQLVHRDKRVVAVEGDSAFGFSGMEVEVACRHRLPITFIILNNNGVGGGPSEVMEPEELPPPAYMPNAHYEKVIEAFGGLGLYVETPDELGPALKQAMDYRGASIVNVMIGRGPRRQRQFSPFAAPRAGVAAT